MIDWGKLRQEDFPSVKDYVYLDHAAGGLVSRPAFEAASGYWQESLNQGDFVWDEWLERKEEARRNVAQFINADPEEVAFVHSTSEGMNLIVDLLKSDGEVMMSDMEFPASTVPWLHQTEKVHFLSSEDNKTLPKLFKEKWSSSIKTILSSYVQYATGFRQDLKALSEIAKEREAHFVVNCSQALGAFPIDVKAMGVDCMTGNSYKWMMAGYGGGVLYIRKGLLESKKPSFAGWRSVDDPDRYDNKNTVLNPNCSRFEYGGPSFPSYFSLGAACSYFDSIGKKEIQERILFLTDYLIEQAQKKNIPALSPIEPEYRSGIVILKVSDPEKAAITLFKEKIFSIPRGGGLRVAPHFYNNEKDIDRLLYLL